MSTFEIIINSNISIVLDIIRDIDKVELAIVIY
jgi:hypothetical protein